MSLSATEPSNETVDIDEVALRPLSRSNTNLENIDLDQGNHCGEGTTPCAETDLSKAQMAATGLQESGEGMDKLLQRMKSDIMFELRSIQYGERPVTGQAHRDNLQQFMAKHLQVDSERRSGKENVPSNVDDATEHRPEAVVVEVQGMIERRPVSSVLQSAAFRRQLENVIRGSIDTANRRSAIRTSNSPTPQRPSPTPRRTIHRTRAEERSEAQTRPVLRRSESNESVESFNSAVSSLEDDRNVDEDEEVAPITQGASIPAMGNNVHESDQNPTVGADAPVEARTPSEVNRPSTPPEIPYEGLAWGDISRIQREELVQEISELLHSRLVSSTLDGEFRATLELQMEQRVAQAEGNRQAVSDAINRLPRSGIARNDFSHLGIPPVEGDNWDNVSISSVSAHSVPYAQTNTYLSREVQGLKTQINEMKKMLKLNFDLQMDMQRAIRQEVAAALNKCSCNGASAIADQSTHSRPVSDTHCLICLDRHSDSVLYQCGHMCVCYICGRDLISRGLNCPVCRAPIKDVIRTYKTNSE